MLDSPQQDPQAGGVMRGIALICAIGIALGVAYNALGLASRPKYGLAWIKTATKIESLEALQSAPAPTAGSTAPAGTAHAAPAEGSATDAAPVPGIGASSATATPAPARKPATKPAADVDEPSRAAARSTASSADPPPAAPRPATPPATKSGVTPKATAWTPPGGSAPSAGGAAPGTATAGGATSASTGAAADLPVIPDVTGPLKVEIATLKRLHDANAALVLDAREAPEYAEGHIRGALSLSYNDALAEPERVKNLDPGGRPIVVYCGGGDCELSINLAKVLVEAGKRRVLIYEAGYPEWQAAGYPVAHGPNP